MPPDEPRTHDPRAHDPEDPDAPQYVTVSLVKQSLGPLTYAVPAALRADVKPGVRVEGPLARARAVGYVLGPAEAPATDQEVRELNDVLDSEPLLTPQQLSLAQFAARYYLSPLAEALRLTHPAGMDMVEHRTLEITAEGRLALGRADALLSVQGLELDPVEQGILEGVEKAPQDAVRLLKRIKGARHRHLVGLTLKEAVERRT